MNSDLDRKQPEPHPWVAERRKGLRFGLAGGPRDDWGAVRAYVQAAEDHGFDCYWRSDHPTSQSDTWTTLAALSEATSTIRLGSLVSCAYYRHPVVLARMAADVDVISRGRLVLGIGSGDLPAEFEKLGLRFPPVRERSVALADTLAIVRPLLQGRAVTHVGQTYSAYDVELPDPIAPQHPHIPLLVAGGGERTTLPLVGRYADASNLAAAPWGGGAYTPDDIHRKSETIRQSCRDAGRAPDAVLLTTLLWPVILANSRRELKDKVGLLTQRTVEFVDRAALIGSPEEAIKRIGSLRAAGFEYFIFSVPAYDEETVQLLVGEVIPGVRGLADNAVLD